MQLPRFSVVYFEPIITIWRSIVNQTDYSRLLLDKAVSFIKEEIDPSCELIELDKRGNYILNENCSEIDFWELINTITQSLAERELPKSKIRESEYQEQIKACEKFQEIIDKLKKGKNLLEETSEESPVE